MFLSILVTAVLSGAVWLSFGTVSLGAVTPQGLGWFVLAGIASMGLGRWAMYRSVALIGVMPASLYRRLIPVFSLGVGAVFLAQWPDPLVLFGGALILVTVVWGAGGAKLEGAARGTGHLIALAAALGYALAYGFRALGLETVPDPALGTFLGAVTGMLWFLGRAGLSGSPRDALNALICDRGAWHWLTALSLSAGQTLQFFALRDAEVVVVAILGALDTVFTLLLAGYVLRSAPPAGLRLWGAGALCLLGTVLVVA